MKQTYLAFSIIGFIIPNVFVTLESIETGNILLYTNPAATMASMFANRISSIFMIDLLLALVVFFIWTKHEAKTHKIHGVAWVWALTMLFGLAGGFPLFLYLKEKVSMNR